MDEGQLKELVGLDKQADELEAKLKVIKERMEELREALLPQFLVANAQRVNIDGRTVYIRAEYFGSPLPDVSRIGVAKALRESDLGHFVAENYDSRNINSYVKELADRIKVECQLAGRIFDEQAVQAALPEPLRRALKVSFKHSIRISASR